MNVDAYVSLSLLCKMIRRKSCSRNRIGSTPVAFNFHPFQHRLTLLFPYFPVSRTIELHTIFRLWIYLHTICYGMVQWCQLLFERNMCSRWKKTQFTVHTNIKWNEEEKYRGKKKLQSDLSHLLCIWAVANLRKGPWIVIHAPNMQNNIIFEGWTTGPSNGKT